MASVHNLGDRTLYNFRRRARGEPDVVAPPVRDAIGEEAAMSDVEDGAAQASGPTCSEDGSTDWVAWDRGQQRDVERFRQCKPCGPVTVTIVSLQPAVAASRWLVAIHGEQWEQEQRAAFAASGDRQTIGTELLKGEGFLEFSRMVEQRLWDPQTWVALPSHLKTVRLRSLASGALARSLCGVAQLITSDIHRLPHELQRLVCEPEAADEIMRIPQCRREVVAEEFF